MKIVKQGEKVTLDPNLKRLDIEITWSASPQYDIDGTAFLVGRNEKVLNESDMIFYNNPCSKEQSVIRLNPLSNQQEQFLIELERIPTSVKKVSLVLTIHEAISKRQTFQQVSNLTVTIRNGYTGVPLISFPLVGLFSNETAIVLLELYQYRGEWKVNAVGKGFFGGLADICKNFGLSVSDDEEGNTSVKPIPTPPKKAKDFESKFEASLYGKLVQRKKNFKLKLNHHSIDEAGNIFSRTYEQIKEKDHYLERSLLSMQYRVSHINGQNTFDVTMEYRTTKKQEQVVDQRISEIIKTISPTLSPVEKVKAVHDFIVDYVDYDQSLTEFTAYAALVKGKTVCQGYAMLAYRLLNELGIETIIVRGDAHIRQLSRSGRHAWNIVNINGEWYHLDCTWDDPIGSNRIHYDYFLISDSAISKTHSWDYSKYPKANRNFTR